MHASSKMPPVSQKASTHRKQQRSHHPDGENLLIGDTILGPMPVNQGSHEEAPAPEARAEFDARRRDVLHRARDHPARERVSTENVVERVTAPGRGCCLVRSEPSGGVLLCAESILVGPDAVSLPELRRADAKAPPDKALPGSLASVACSRLGRVGMTMRCS